MATTKFNKSALIVVDMQEDFCEPNGTLAVKDGREVAKIINSLLDQDFAVKVATRDWHPQDHISFASNHPGTSPFTSEHTILNPQNKEENQTTLLWPDHCVQDTLGAELIPELHSNKISRIISKGTNNQAESYSGFGPPFRSPKIGMTELDDVLKTAGVSQVYVVGLAYDYCVKHTAIDAVEHGYETIIVRDATKAVDQSEASLDKLAQELADHGVRVVDSTSLRS